MSFHAQRRVLNGVRATSPSRAIRNDAPPGISCTVANSITKPNTATPAAAITLGAVGTVTTATPVKSRHRRNAHALRPARGRKTIGSPARSRPRASASWFEDAVVSPDLGMARNPAIAPPSTMSAATSSATAPIRSSESSAETSTTAKTTAANVPHTANPAHGATEDPQRATHVRLLPAGADRARPADGHEYDTPRYDVATKAVRPR